MDLNPSVHSDWREATSGFAAVFAPPQSDSCVPGIAASLLVRLLDEVDHGMLLVAVCGTVRYANQSAWRDLTREGPLCIAQGRLKARLAAHQDKLREALADAARGLRRLVSLAHQGSDFSVAVLPMADADPHAEPLALLTFSKRTPCEALSVDFFARSHGLTGAEARVLQACCNGEKPKEIAARTGVAISTVRTHVRSARMKTQSASLRELVRRLAVLPPITSAMKAMRAH